MVSCKRMTKTSPLKRSLLGLGLLAVVGLSQGCQTINSAQGMSSSERASSQAATPPEADTTEIAECPPAEAIASVAETVPTEAAISSAAETAPTEAAIAESTNSEATNPEPTTPDALYTVLNEQGNAEYEVPGRYVFESATLPSQKVDFDEKAMLNVLQATRAYFDKHGCNDMKVLRSGLLSTQNVQHADVLSTLDFMIQTLEEDLTAGIPTRLKDIEFLNDNFRVIRWMGYDPAYPSEERLRITKYAVFTHPGSRERTETFNTPVYALKNEGEDQSFITEYTKQEVLSGVFETGGPNAGQVKTLAYMTRQGFEDALMQGTAFVNFDDGTSTYFNVDKNNGIAFVAGVDPWQQERYWYFKEVNKLNGYGYDSAAKIPIEPGVTFAGDIMNIGLGKLVAIEAGSQTLKFGLIADTGGAFLPNLGQLDYFAGVFPTREAYQQAVIQMPTYAQAYLLIKK
ncbi:MAG: hypothetical protein AAFV85_23755 [Cyanobacteria bacterium J06634_6]